MTNTAKITAPSAFANIDIMLNLDARDKAPIKAFSFLKHTDDNAPYVLNPETYNSVVTTPVFDTQGMEHIFSSYFVKTMVKNVTPPSGEVVPVSNEWNAYFFLDGRNITTIQNQPKTDSSEFNAFAVKFESFMKTMILPEGEITATPFKLSFDTEGQLENVDNVNLPQMFKFKAATDEQLANYAATKEPIPAAYEPLTTSRVVLNQTNLSEMNQSLKYLSTPDKFNMDFGVDFTHSMQVAAPFGVSSLQQGWNLRGTDENDRLIGSAGNDSLLGGYGADKMTGGSGADTFIFYNVDETELTTKTRDIITDFKHSEGDKLDFSGFSIHLPISFDNNLDISTNLINATANANKLSFIGSAAFSKTDAAGQLRFDPLTHTLYGSIDADNKAEFSVQLNGVKSLSADDFIFSN